MSSLSATDADNAVKIASVALQRFTAADSACFALHTATVFLASGRRFRLKMKCHGFPKACDHKYLFDHWFDRFDHCVDRFDHRLSKRCSALGCINTLADWSTFKSAAEQSPTPIPTVEPVLKAIPIATPTPNPTPSPSPQPTRARHRQPRRHR
jgi:hypothetical protein